jgi:hypothetical protein
VLVGDSYADQWRTQITASLPPSVKLIELTVFSCKPADGEGSSQVTPKGVHCGAHTRWVFKQLETIKPGLIVASSNKASAVKTKIYAAKLKSLASRLLWIGYVPSAKAGFDTCLSASSSLSRCAGPSLQSELGNQGLPAAVLSAGGYFWDVEKLFCLRSTCPAFIDNYPVRADGDHLTNKAVSDVSAELSAAVQAALR